MHDAPDNLEECILGKLKQKPPLASAPKNEPPRRGRCKSSHKNRQQREKQISLLCARSTWRGIQAPKDRQVSKKTNIIRFRKRNRPETRFRYSQPPFGSHLANGSPLKAQALPPCGSKPSVAQRE